MLTMGNNRCVSWKGSTMPVTYQYQLNYPGPLMPQKFEGRKKRSMISNIFFQHNSFVFSWTKNIFSFLNMKLATFQFCFQVEDDKSTWSHDKQVKFNWNFAKANWRLLTLSCYVKALVHIIQWKGHVSKTGTIIHDHTLPRTHVYLDITDISVGVP